MRRFVIAVAGVMACASVAQAQVTVPNYVVQPGSSVNVTVTATAGQNFAVIASVNSSGFSYGGVALAVGPDVAILAVGVVPASGQVVIPVTPPFPTSDRYYVQAVVSASPDFLPPTPLGSVTLISGEAARVYMPIGGIVQANGTPSFITPGVTVTRTGLGVYQITHTNFIGIPSAIPSITPTGGATVMSIANNANQTTVTLSDDATFYFTIEAIRR